MWTCSLCARVTNKKLQKTFIAAQLELEADLTKISSQSSFSLRTEPWPPHPALQILGKIPVYQEACTGNQHEMQDTHEVVLLDMSGDLTPLKIARCLEKAILDLAKLMLGHYDHGTVLVASLIHDGRIYTANVGDSRSILIAANEQAQDAYFRLSCDHRPTQLRDAVRIWRKGGKITFRNDSYRVENDLPLSRTLGAMRLKKYGVIYHPDLTVFDLNELNDLTSLYLLLGSDGLFDMIDEQTIRLMLLEAAHAEQRVANYLLNEAYHRWQQSQNRIDDITIVFMPIAYSSELPKDKALLLMVADGHGSNQSALLAKQKLAKLLQQRLVKATP